jgi:hypothetical protein
MSLLIEVNFLFATAIEALDISYTLPSSTLEKKSLKLSL